MLMKKILPDNSNLPPFETVVLLGAIKSKITNSDGTVIEHGVVITGKLTAVTKDGPIWDIDNSHTLSKFDLTNIFSAFNSASLFTEVGTKFKPTHYMDLTNLKFES